PPEAGNGLHGGEEGVLRQVRRRVGARQGPGQAVDAVVVQRDQRGERLPLSGAASREEFRFGPGLHVTRARRLERRGALYSSHTDIVPGALVAAEACGIAKSGFCWGEGEGSPLFPVSCFLLPVSCSLVREERPAAQRAREGQGPAVRG